MIQLSSKLPNVGTTIFTTMSVLAQQHNAINLGQGFPDFDMSEELTALVNEAMKNGHNQYTHMNGHIPLREALAEKADYLYNANINPDTEITITPGGTYALYTALTSILQTGDEVIVFEPAYDSYIPSIEITGAKAVTIPLTFPAYKIDWSEVRKKVTEKTRVIMINSPHNPSGAVLLADDIEQLRVLVKDTQIIIVSDEVYEHLIFDGFQHESILRHPDLLERSFVCFSFGKVYNCTGWKLGYCVAPAYLMKEFRKVHQFNAFSCDTPKQVALATFLKKREAYVELGAFLEQKRDYFQNGMKETKLQALPTHGSYFQIYSYENLSKESEREFAIFLTKNYGVATIPVSALYRQEVNNKVLRFCFSKKEDTLDAAIERLLKL